MCYTNSMFGIVLHSTVPDAQYAVLYCVNNKTLLTQDCLGVVYLCKEVVADA
jgi:hypothetical protein